MIKMLKPQDTIFYLIEQTIQAYRRNAQSELNTLPVKVTVNQILILNMIIDNPSVTQTSLAELVFQRYCISFQNYQQSSKKRPD